MIRQFRTVLESKEISFYNEKHILEYNKESDEILDVTDMVIIWQVEYEVREWGIKSAVASVVDFEISIFQDYYTDPDTNETLKGFEETLKNSDEWKVQIHSDNHTFDCVAISECEIDFLDGTIDFY